MAQGNEVIFLLTEADLEAIIPPEELLEIKAEFEQGSDEYNYELAQAVQGQVEAELARIHTRLLAHIGPVSTHPNPLGGSSVTCVTLPDGQLQRFEPFRVDMFVSEGGPSCFGVTMWSRYRPIWLDWEHPHGGSGSNFILDNDTMKLIEEARAAIAEVIPGVAGGSVAVVQQSY